MKGLIIIGSAKMGSHTNALAHYLKGHFEDQYFEVEIFDLAEHPIHQLDVLAYLRQVKYIKII
ncbi:NAD(P)H-dependent FMN reductase [Staphylococcus cohnii]